ncbi:glycosyltransferase family 4 protein [bacterium]|nr:glycosyltransferase family 4 protein [bacterium]
MIQPSFSQVLPQHLGTKITDAKVVVLNNYFRAHHSAVYREVNKRVANLKVLLSTPMEPNRNWEVEWDGLDVTIQKNWTFTTTWRHSKGFSENNFIHFPIDTIKQLTQLQPDVVFSYELGVRTLLSSRYCRKNGVPLVMVGNMSEQIESERGFLRKRLRKFLKSRVDFCTYNGPSCKRYLLGLGIDPERLLYFPYAYDLRKIYDGPIETSEDNVTRLMFCGALDSRKGLSVFLKQLSRWAKANPQRDLELHVCGTGETEKLIEHDCQPNLRIYWKGHCNNQQLAETYALADLCVFPSLADEWGLVTVESLASGTPLLGSIYAQSVESLIRDGINGWTFRPDISDEFYSVLDKALTTDAATLRRMAGSCRASVSHVSPSQSANHFANVLELVLAKGKKGRK